MKLIKKEKTYTIEFTELELNTLFVALGQWDDREYIITYRPKLRANKETEELFNNIKMIVTQ